MHANQLSLLTMKSIDIDANDYISILETIRGRPERVRLVIKTEDIKSIEKMMSFRSFTKRVE